MSDKLARTHHDLLVYKKAFDAALQIHELTAAFLKAEAWCKRRYHKAFISKLSDAESEAAETQV
ncbi:MAG TPA: four helix bundle protein [Anaerolineae bacterium]|jgi:hypothetical protein|nr:four helix bundle protein [Anaerolineae bacterium]